MTNETFVPKDFVCMGMRLVTGGKKGVELGILNDKLEIVDRLTFSLSRGVNLSVGHVYTGATFSEGSVKGLARVNWRPMKWPNAGEVLEWEAKEAAAQTDYKHRKLHADATRLGEIERIMQPLRSQYAALRARYDMEGCSALELAVKQVLTKPLRKSEE